MSSAAIAGMVASMVAIELSNTKRESNQQHQEHQDGFWMSGEWFPYPDYGTVEWPSKEGGQE